MQPQVVVSHGMGGCYSNLEPPNPQSGDVLDLLLLLLYRHICLFIIRFIHKLSFHLFLGLRTLLLVLGLLSRTCLTILCGFILVIYSFHSCLLRVIQSAMFSCLSYIFIRYSVSSCLSNDFPYNFHFCYCSCPLIFILSGLVSHAHVIARVTTLL
jgi:hypothetical protein